jgi:hypothetical protein
MRATFEDAISAGSSRPSKKDRRAIERERVQTLCEQIQFAIYLDDRTRLDDLMCELALATANEARIRQAGMP